MQFSPEALGAALHPIVSLEMKQGEFTDTISSEWKETRMRSSPPTTRCSASTHGRLQGGSRRRREKLTVGGGKAAGRRYDCRLARLARAVNTDPVLAGSEMSCRFLLCPPAPRWSPSTFNINICSFLSQSQTSKDEAGRRELVRLRASLV